MSGLPGGKAVGRLVGMENTTKNSKELLGRRIRSARIRSSVSRERLAKRLGCGTAAVSAWEVGKDSPLASLLPELVQELQTTPSYLVLGR